MGTCSSLRRRMMMDKGSLPYDAEVEYLESTGTQYIDTLYRINSYDFYYEIKYMQTANSTAQAFLINQFIGNESWRLAIYSNASNKLSGVWGGHWLASSTSSDRNIHTMKLQNRKLYKDGVSLLTFNATSNFYQTDNNVIIFGRENGQSTISARVYYVKIHYKNELVRDLIPVRVGQVGYMYDRVSGQLFGNAGTGSFILGPDV